jgi:uncharacterized protein YcbK (DUF882 family)
MSEGSLPRGATTYSVCRPAGLACLPRPFGVLLRGSLFCDCRHAVRSRNTAPVTITSGSDCATDSHRAGEITVFVSAWRAVSLDTQGRGLARRSVDGMGDLARNFSRSEFRCKDGCGRDYPTQDLVDVLQRARTAQGRSLRIVSGVRCASHNRAVGGSPTSQHLSGRAADVPGGYASAGAWRQYGAIGIGVRSGQVVHVDVTPGRASFTFQD